jgi:hypothetical protein
VCAGSALSARTISQDLLSASGDLPPTLDNKVKVVIQRSVTKAFLLGKKASVIHPQMRGYSELALRHRFLKGFCQEARDRLRSNLVIEIGRRGLASKPFPLSRQVLMDAAILVSDGFPPGKERDNIPAWRDGAAGRMLQCRMVDAATTRYFTHELWKNSDRSSNSLFSSGSTWAGFGRLAHHVDALLQASFGGQASWPDSVTCFHRDLWRGEHDFELTRLASLLPSNIDNMPSKMQESLKAQSPP